MRSLKSCLFCFGIVTALAASMGVAHAASCSTVSNTVTCTGSSNGATVSPGSGTNGVTVGSPSPATIVVNGGAGTVASLSLTLHGYTSSTGGLIGNASRNVGILLKSPGGRNMQIMRADGDAGCGQPTPVNCQNNLTVTLQDGAAAFPDPLGSGNTGIWTTGGTFKPTAYSGGTNPPFSASGSPDYTVSGGPAMAHSAAPLGSDTLTSVFAGDTVNGTWSLYLVDDAHAVDITFSSWDIAVTFSAASTPSTTTLTPSPTTAYTTNSVTLTAQVTAGATGTVTFKDNSVNLTCSGGNPATISSNQATCITSFSTEGIHPLTALYSGDSTFVSSSGSANVFIQKHATNVGTTYCNTGTVTNTTRSDLAYSATTPYPSVIFVGDGVNTDINTSVSTVSVTLKGFTSAFSNNVGFLLVAPDGTHAYDFWKSAGAGAAGTGNYTVVDGATQLPNGSALSPGTYGPGAFNIPPDPFTPGPPAPAPQVPGTFSVAPPEGSKTFLTSFTGAPAHGAWSLFLYNAGGAGSDTSLASGWCLNITPATGHPTTVTVTSNPATYATTGAPVTFTATVSSSPAVGNTGTVTFTEDGTPLAGAPNSGVSNVSGNVATTLTISLPEGDHTITAQYHDSSNTFSDSFGTVSMREDKTTSAPTIAGSAYGYCNAGAILIPKGTIITNDFGPATPNPSNVFVTNLPGTIKSVGVTLKQFHLAHGGFNIESLLVGPNGVSVPTTAQTLDFFSLVGNNTAFGPQDTTFADVFSRVTCTTTAAAPGTAIAPTSCGSTAYFSSPFYTLPGIQHAAPNGAFTFNTGNAGNPAVYSSTNGNGTWSLYFNQPVNDTGSGVNSGWCVNFTQNLPDISLTAIPMTHSPATFTRGQSASFTVTAKNLGPGPTGDPTLTITDTLPAGLTFTSGTGAGWSCSAVGQLVTCTNPNPIAVNASSAVTINVTVGTNNTTADTISNSATLTTGTGGDDPATLGNNTTSSGTITVAGTNLTINKTHTDPFTQGQSGATYSITVHNNGADNLNIAGHAGATVGTVEVTDAVPSAFTVTAVGGTGWTCQPPPAVDCTLNAPLAVGSTTNPITATVTVSNSMLGPLTNTAVLTATTDQIGPSSNNHHDDVTNITQVPSQMAANASTTPQSALVNAAFGTLLGVTVKDAGNHPVQGVSVTFTPPGSGASGAFAVAPGCTAASCVVTTNASGVATASAFTANGTPGVYNVHTTSGSLTAVDFALTNIAQPTISKAFGASQIALNGTTTLTFTIVNPNPALPLTGLAFTDTLPAGLTSFAGFNNNCGGSWSAPGGVPTLSGGTLPGGQQCTAKVDVKGTTAGVYHNTSSALSSDQGGTGATSNTIPLTVVGPPAVTKSFSAASIPLNGTVTMTLVVANPNTTVTLNGVGVADTLPAGLVVASSPNVVQGCAGGAVTAIPGASSVSVSIADGALVASGSCTTKVDLTGTTAGDKPNATAGATSTEGGTGAASNTAPLTVVAPPTIAKAFGASSIALNTTTTVTFTIANPAANTVSETGVQFSDTLPGGLTVDSTPGVVNGCGGSVTAAANSSSIALLNGTVGVNTNCTLTVTVKGVSVGLQSNTTTAVSSTNGGTGTFSNTATVTVTAPDLLVGKTHAPSTYTVNDQNDTITITVTNNGNGPSSGTMTVTDTLPGGLTFNGSPTASWVCGANGSNPVVCTSTNALTASGGALALVLNVNVSGSTGSPLTNNVSVACTCTESNTGNNTGSDSITVSQLGGTTTAASSASANFSSSSQPVTLSATVTSAAGTVNAGTVTFTVFDSGNVPVGPPAVSGTVAAGAASASFTLPGGTAVGTYSIHASYSGGGNFAASHDNTHTLTVNKVTPTITWSNPSNITFGSALSGVQLNATASVPGAFVYNPPAGTVLPAGNGQTLSVQFTPTDTTNYNNASANVSINVTPNAGPATLVVTRKLARDGVTHEVVVTVTVSNTGGSAATGVQLTSAKIGTTATTTGLPQSLPDIPGGGSVSTTVRFPGSVGTAGTAAVLSVGGAYSGGAFGGSARITLP